MTDLENLAILPKERELALLTIAAMQHPNQLGMHADWWIKWLRRSVALDALYTSSATTDEDLRAIAYEAMKEVMDQFQSFVVRVEVADGFTTYTRTENIILQSLRKAVGR